MKKILLTWAKGMLAYDFQKYCGADFEIIGMDRNKLDIISLEQVRNVIAQIKPNIILNCAAYTDVDEAEDTGKLINFQVNALGVYHLAKVAKELNCDLITISTDYVFDGVPPCHSEHSEASNTSRQGYLPNDICNPINTYGMAKYLGEELAKAELPSTIIVRTSWLYGGWPAFKNFPNTMLQLAETKSELKVINDQFGLPTFTKDLTLALKTVIEQIEQWKGNIFHLSNSWDTVSWFDFAQEIFKLTSKETKLLPCSSSQFPTKAQRPKFSRLINESEIQLRNWKEWLREYVENFRKK